jgi:hypothetical protein
MRNPRRSRDIALGILFGGAATLIATRAIVEPAAEGTGHVLLVIAVSAMTLAAIALPIFELESRRLERLRRGEDVIARWRVSREEWERFVAQEPARDAVEGARVNIITGPVRGNADGVDVVVGTTGVIVNDEFHSMPHVSLKRTCGPFWIDGSPPCLEFRVSAHTTVDVASEWALRFPIAAGAEADAQRVVAFYSSKISGASGTARYAAR